MPIVAAYYLPQFYAVDLNSRWWGEGFTEWNSLVKAHRGWRSPADTLLTPGELGFYDLRSTEPRIRQAELAKEHGIDAFAIYHYYSAGERVLGDVVDRILDDGAPDHPFFFCWANHDWTLAWQGRPDEITWQQRYDEHASDDHINWLIRAFRDPRYLSWDGKPVVQIYDIASIPELTTVLERWRRQVREAGFPGLIVLGCTGATAPRSTVPGGPDAWVQTARPAIAAVPRRVRLGNSLRSAAGIARFLWFRDTLLRRSQLRARLEADRDAAAEPLVPMVMCAWNNVGRRSRRAWYMPADPVAFRSELTRALSSATSQRPGVPPLVLVNAWNEWGEGMSIEPSVEFGRQFLEAVRKAKAAISVGAVRHGFGGDGQPSRRGR